MSQVPPDDVDDPRRSPREELDQDICLHIFTASAALVGVCLTGIGLFRITTELQKLSSAADNVLAIDALAFLVSCILAYFGLRSRARGRRRRLERIADAVFLLALVLMAVVCGLVAYELV